MDELVRYHSFKADFPMTYRLSVSSRTIQCWKWPFPAPSLLHKAKNNRLSAWRIFTPCWNRTRWRFGKSWYVYWLIKSWTLSRRLFLFHSMFPKEKYPDNPKIKDIPSCCKPCRLSTGEAGGLEFVENYHRIEFMQTNHDFAQRKHQREIGT